MVCVYESIPPLAMFTKTFFGFIFEKAAALNKPLVSLVNGQEIITKSLLAES